MLASIAKSRLADSKQLLRNFAAFGVAELLVRLVRLLTVIVIARQLVPEIVGLAALTLTLFELIRVLANIGVGQKIIACESRLLDATCNGAHRIFWVWCILVAGIQIAAAMVLAFYFEQFLAGQMLAVLALVYPFMPGGLVQCFLLMRHGKAAETARIAATQTILDHILTACLLLIWPSQWSIVLPKILTAPIWLFLTRKAFPWSPKPQAGYAAPSQLVHFGLSVLATDMALALRSQLDKLIVAATLGVSALGTYYFAFNAGLGIVSSLITAFGTVLLPILCSVPEGQARSQKLKFATVLGAFLFVPVVAAQVLLAPFYVPLIFGEHWVHAIPLISILCLASIPTFVAAVATVWLRAEGRPHIDAKVNILSCIVALAALYFGAAFGGLTEAALCWVIGLTVISVPFAITVIGRATRTNLEEFKQETFS